MSDQQPKESELTDRIELDKAFDELTPLQQLAMETVSSRHRLGHRIWTFHTNQALTKALNQLETRGLISILSPITYQTKRVALTQYGKDMLLLPDYVPPIAQCPVSCDDDCEDICHENHQPTWKRDHQPENCPAVQYLKKMAEM